MADKKRSDPRIGEPDRGDKLHAGAAAPGESKRKTPTYVEAVRGNTPRSTRAVTGPPEAHATLMGPQGSDGRSSGAIPVVSPASPPRTSTPTGSARTPTPGSLSRAFTPLGAAVAPAPRTVTPSDVTVPGTPRHPTPFPNPATAPLTDRNLSPPAQRSVDGVPEELQERPGSGGARTRIGLPTVAPRVLVKRREGEPDGAPPAEAPLPGMTREPSHPNSRQTVLLSKVKRTGATPPSSPAAPAPAPAPAREAEPEPAARARPARVRPAVPPAEIHPTKHMVTADHRRLVVLDPNLVAQGAAIRSLRHRLSDKGDPRVILVSSAGHKEGKTFCASNLALALSEIRRGRVLLLDANRHSPALAQLFGVARPSSLINQLELHRHNLAAPWSVIELSTHDLHLAPLDPNADAGRAIDGPLLATCLDSLRAAYDYVIIDGPPVSAGPDVPLLEDAVDGILFTARAEHSSAATLRNALDQISPQDLLGVVLLEI